MIIRSFLLVSLGVLSSQGCSVGALKFDQIMEEKVSKKAAFDFECSEAELNVIKIDSGSYGVIGCGKKATYVGVNNACSTHAVEKYIKENCQVVPDTFVKNK